MSCRYRYNESIMDKKLLALLNNNFDRYEVYMDKSFKVKKSRLIEVEAKIRSVVGNEPDYVKIPCEEHSRIELLLLLDERRSLLNWMFKETPEEWERMKVVNSRLSELTKELRLKMADVCDGLAKRKRDAFDDDYEVCGTLRFSYNGEDSVLPYKGAEIYGSDYRLMTATNNFLTGNDSFHFLKLSCNYDDSRDRILESGNCDDDYTLKSATNSDADYILQFTSPSGDRLATTGVIMHGACPVSPYPVKHYKGFMLPLTREFVF